MNKQPQVSFQIVALVALALFAVGCASTPTAAPSPLGTWVTTVTEEEAPLFAGQWEITFAENGRYSGRHSKSPGMIEGRYSFTQDQIVFQDESGVCVNYQFSKGTYKWSIEKDVLTLTAIDDQCYNRRKVASGRTWSSGKLREPPPPTTAPMLK